MAWLVMGFLTNTTGALFPVRYRLQDLANDLISAINMFCAGLTAGLAVAWLAPSLQFTGRWLCVPGTVLLAWFGNSFGEYMRDSARETYLLTFISYASDFNLWPSYAYLGYSASMAICAWCESRESKPFDRHHSRRAGLVIAMVAVGYLLSVGSLVNLCLHLIDPAWRREP
jgi:hypothetical protein